MPEQEWPEAHQLNLEILKLVQGRPRTEALAALCTALIVVLDESIKLGRLPPEISVFVDMHREFLLQLRVGKAKGG